MRNRKYVLIGVIAATMLVFNSCGKTDTTNATETTIATEEDAQSSDSSTAADTAVTAGQITAIDGNNITVLMGTVSDLSDMSGRDDSVGSGDSFGTSDDFSSLTPDSTTSDSATSDSTTSDGTTADSSAPDSAAQDSSALAGGSMPSGGMGGDKPSGNSNGTAPSGDSNGTAPSGDSSGTAPSGDSSGTAPSGFPSDGEFPTDGSDGFGHGSMSGSVFMAGEESQTIVISDATMIYQESDSETDTENTQAALSDLQVGDIISFEQSETGEFTSITILNAFSFTDMQQNWDGQGNGDQSTAPGADGTAPDSQGTGDTGMGMPGNSSSGVDSYAAVTTYTEDTVVDGETFMSRDTDENAVLIQNGAAVDLNDITIYRTSDDSTGGDNSSFYGVGAGLLVTDGTAYITDGHITTDAAGGAGIFAYNDGVAYVNGTSITTSQNTSGGIHVAGGGTLYAWDVNAETDGDSAAAVRSDRGGGTMVIDGGSYTSNGNGSPAVYCTADISINDATLTATGSEAVCIEGLNTLRLFDTKLTGNMSDDEQNDSTWTVILYQSMSGDSEVGNSEFEMVGGKLISENGGVFYTTNTECTITLQDVAITASDDSEYFLMCSGNTNARGWGTAGSNGSDCLFTAIDQEMNGDVIWDSISKLDFYMTEGSSLTGAFLDDESYAGNGGEGYCSLIISADSKWIVTDNSTVTSLANEGTIVDEDGKTVSIVGTDGTVYVAGDSDLTVTVSKYFAAADLSGAGSVDSFSDYAVEMPAELQ